MSPSIKHTLNVQITNNCKLKTNVLKLRTGHVCATVGDCCSRLNCDKLQMEKIWYYQQIVSCVQAP